MSKAIARVAAVTQATEFVGDFTERCVVVHGPEIASHDRVTSDPSAHVARVSARLFADMAVAGDNAAACSIPGLDVLGVAHVIPGSREHTGDAHAQQPQNTHS